MAKQFLSVVCLFVAAGLSTACPEGGPPAGTAPGAMTWVNFSLSPPLITDVAIGGTLRYGIRVIDKSQLDAGVEFQAAALPGGPVVRVSPVRLSDTARDAEVFVDIPPNTSIQDYELRVQARLVVSGQVAPTPNEEYGRFRVVTGQAGFTLVCEPSEATVRALSAPTISCRAIRENFNDPIDVTIGPRPEALLVSSPSGRIDETSGGFTFVVDRRPQSALPAFYDLVITGRAGGIESRATVRILLPAF